MQAASFESTISRVTCDFTRNPNQVQSTASGKAETFEVSFPQGEAFCLLYVQCALTSVLLQMIGVDPGFDFDVAAANGPWMNALEDEVLNVQPRRNRVPVQPPGNQAPVDMAGRIDQFIRNRIDLGMTILTDMGMLERYGHDLCRFMLDRHDGQIDRTLDALTALGAR
jgi:hypothetical protein